MNRIFRTDDFDYASVEYGRTIVLITINGIIKACLRCNMLKNAADCQDKLKSLTGKRFILVL